MSQLVLDNLVLELRNTKNPFLSRIFGFQQRFLESDPSLQLDILRRSERIVYGADGIEAYERSQHPEVERLARRSLAQYLCQQEELDSTWIKIAWWLGMMVSIPPLIVYLTFHTLLNRRKRDIPEARDAEIIIFLKFERLAAMLCGVFPGKKLYVHTKNTAYLGASEWSYFFRAVSACPSILLRPKLVVNLLRWLSHYGYIVHHYSPKAVAFCFELVASSSLITGYLRERGARHLNVTHGERVFCAHGAFCEFDEDYVWGQHFAEIGARLKERATFRIHGGEAHTELFRKYRRANQPRPKRLLITHNPFLSSDGPDFQVVLKMLRLLDSSWEIAVRRHPAWDISFAKYSEALRANGIIFKDEPPTDISLKEALAQSRIVVGGSSTALVEAAIAGCKVIYLAGVAHPSTVLDRHQGSENILYATSETDRDELSRFLAEPANLSAEEDRLINFLAQVAPSLEGEKYGI